MRRGNNLSGGPVDKSACDSDGINRLASLAQKETVLILTDSLRSHRMTTKQRMTQGAGGGLRLALLVPEIYDAPSRTPQKAGAETPDRQAKGNCPANYVAASCGRPLKTWSNSASKSYTARENSAGNHSATVCVPWNTAAGKANSKLYDRATGHRAFRN